MAKLAPGKRPKCKSYTSVVAAVNEQLATAKLQFFSFIAMTLQPFLELYQSDFPMIPYMFADIIKIVKTLMKLFIKADVVDNSSYKDFKKIDLSNKDNFISSYSINISGDARNTILELKKDIVNSKEISSFQKECRTFIISFVEKLFERMLNGISILKNVTIINPQKALEFVQQKCIESFQVYIQYLARISIVSTVVADKSRLEYSEFLTTYSASKKDVFEYLIGKPKG